MYLLSGNVGGTKKKGAMSHEIEAIAIQDRVLHFLHFKQQKSFNESTKWRSWELGPK